MSGDLVFYTHPMSRGRIVRWMLEEVGQPYRTEYLDYGTSMKDAAYLAINPMGKVPALTHGGAVVTECAAICAYLADAFPHAGLAPPPGDPRRAAYFRWLFFAAGPLESAITVRLIGNDVPSDKRGIVGFGSYDTVLDTLEQAVSRDAFIAGDSFSAADVYVGAHISWGMQFGTIEKRAAFEAYWDRLKDRPAHVRATAIDDERIAAQATASS